MANGGLPTTPSELLTPRQLEVLELLAKGLTNREIARVLEIAPGTAKNHVAAVLEALEVTNRTEAAVVLADWAAATARAPPWSSMHDGVGDERPLARAGLRRNAPPWRSCASTTGASIRAPSSPRAWPRT